MPMDGEEKKKWLHKMVCKIFNETDLNVKGKIMFINHGKRKGRNIPIVEVKIDTKEAAMSLRRCFVAKKP